MLTICPKCKQQFECCATNIANCHCSTIQLTQKIVQQFKEQYIDCLCANCLLKVVAEHG